MKNNSKIITSDKPAVRTRDSFDFDWKFSRGDFPDAVQPGFKDNAWRDVDLPHDWSIAGPFSEHPGSATSAHLPTGIGWYRKHFTIPAGYKNKKVVIEFDGVYQNSEVWLNGQYLGKRPYGYISFCYDLSPHLNYGGENVIAIKADNSHQPNCRWYSGSGIYRHTWLLVTGKIHVAHWGTFVTTPVADAKASVVQVKTLVQNEGQRAANCTLVTSIIDKKGKVVQTAESGQSIAANSGSYEFVQQLKIETPHLWSVENPYLYTVRSKLSNRSVIVDVYNTTLGIRTAVFDADKGFLLNGRQVKLNGVCLHHEAGPIGAAVPEGVWRRRLEKLKAMGCNSIRTSHNPYSPEFMDMCDEYGFLVMNEIFDEWKEPKRQTPDFGYRIYFDEWAERDVTDFVRRDKNHPSVILWSAGNEIDDQVVPAGVETLRKLVEIFHREDPTRLVTVCCNLIGSQPRGASPEFLAQADVVGYNYVNGKPGRTESYYSHDKQLHPQRRFVGSEDGSLGGPRGEYGWLFSRVIKEVPGGHDDPLMKNIRNNHDLWHEFEQMWKFVKTYDYVAGNYMWTGIDYLGECQWPQKTNTAGIIDSCGFEKDTYYWCQSQWTEKPMVHVLPHWNWQGKEGEYIPVLCYTNCDCVELFLNGQSLGVQGYWFPRGCRFENPARYAAPCTTTDLHLKWTVPWQPGTLKAVGIKNGKVAVTEEITTTGKPVAIGLVVDKTNLTADSRDVAHVTVTVLDVQGRVVPVAENEITFKIQGAGKLIGLDNGDPTSHEDFKGNRRKTFNGLCLAIVQSTNKPGKIQLTATSPKLKSGSVTIAVQ
jgi:beta-galactosidase